MPSGGSARVDVRCRATVGEIGNADQSTSAGQGRPDALEGPAPGVHGVAMNPVDHPHGGGEGKTSGGRHPVSEGQARAAPILGAQRPHDRPPSLRHA
jgi:large subunit ribosomal protein L2